jgi:hypothetical protein
LTLSTAELKAEVYDPVINEICSNVVSVMKKHQPKAFFLFGKLSNSDYLYERLSDIVEDIDVIPEEDLSAAQGTVYHGLGEPLSIQRVTPIHEQKETLVNKEDFTYYDFNYDYYTHVIGIGKKNYVYSNALSLTKKLELF